MFPQGWMLMSNYGTGNTTPPVLGSISTEW